jgi:hypothetical protein
LFLNPDSIERMFLLATDHLVFCPAANFPAKLYGGFHPALPAIALQGAIVRPTDPASKI